MAEEFVAPLWEIIKQWGSPSVALAAAGLAYRFGRANEAVKSDLDQTKSAVQRNTDEIIALKIKTETISTQHADLRAAVAALPTRLEMNDGFAQVREDIREMKRQT